MYVYASKSETCTYMAHWANMYVYASRKSETCTYMAHWVNVYVYASKSETVYNMIYGSFGFCSTRSRMSRVMPTTVPRP